MDEGLYRIIASRNLACASTGGAAGSTTALGAQTYAVEIAVASATGGVRFLIGDSPVADSTSPYLPPNFPMRFKCTPGQKISAISQDAGTPTLVIVELSK